MQFKSLEDFVIQQLELLNLERDAEIAESRKLQETFSAKQLQERGVCILNLVVHGMRSGLYGRTIITFGSKLVGKELPSSNMSSGDIVGIFSNSSASQLEKDQICSGIISCVKSNTIEIALDSDCENIDLNDNECYKLLQLANSVTYRRLKMGLNSLKNYQGPAATLMNTLFGEQVFSSANISLPPVLLGYNNDLVWFNKNLDHSQKEAVEFALKQRELAVVHGPPGTGKTTTVVEIILQTVKAGNRVLACAPSNVAVDNILEKLVSNSSVKAIRLGHPTRMQEAVQNRSLDAVLSNSEARSIVNDVRRDLDAQLKQIPKTKKRGPIFNEIKNLRKELRERETKAVKEVLSHANVILTTLTSATQEGPLKHLLPDHFDYVVIDECSQATESACWLALIRAPRVLLAGDHFQLPPTIISPEAARRGLGLTLMERIIQRKEDGKSCVRMLTSQYRMHRDIMQWASDQLYHGKLEAHSSVASHLLMELPGVEDNEDTGIPLLLLDTAGCDFHESATSEEGSKANSGEAALVFLHVQRLVESGLPARDIAIVTPYNLQVELLRQMLSGKYPQLEIRSVDGFQGREKEAIILSLVRSNSTGQVGFVADVRRLNVACTRARRHLCLVTDSSTTSRATSGLVEYMEQHGEVRSAHQYLQEMDNVVVPEIGNRITGEAAKPRKVVVPSTTTIDNKQSKQEKEEIAAKVKSMLTEWAASAECGASCIKEFPSTLTAYERLIVHQWAEEHGYQHRSVGENHKRRIQIYKSAVVIPQQADEEIQPTQNEQSHVTSFDAPTSLKNDADEALPKVVEKMELKENDLSSSKKKKNKKQNSSSGLESQKVPTKDKHLKLFVPTPSAVSESDDNNVKCDDCKKQVPKQNLALHRLRCTGAGPTEQAVRPKQKPVIKPLPSLISSDGTKDLNRNGKEKDIDDVLSEFRKLDNVCNYATCKTGISLMGQLCLFCQRRFCLSHHLPEIHGCGDAIRRQARSVTLKQGFVAPGSLPVKPKVIETAKRAHLQRKLEKKLEDMSTQRAGKKEEKKKK